MAGPAKQPKEKLSAAAAAVAVVGVVAAAVAVAVAAAAAAERRTSDGPVGSSVRADYPTGDDQPLTRILSLSHLVSSSLSLSLFLSLCVSPSSLHRIPASVRLDWRRSPKKADSSSINQPVCVSFRSRQHND